MRQRHVIDVEHARSAADAGRAMVLTTATTACGFGSLALSHIPALEGGGALIAFGTFACLIATLWVLPAVSPSIVTSKDKTLIF